jgi:hypothetical protein
VVVPVQAFGQAHRRRRHLSRAEPAGAGPRRIYFPAVKALTEGRSSDIRFVELTGAGCYLSEERPEDLARELLASFG